MREVDFVTLWVTPHWLSLPLKAAFSIGVYFHIQANRSHLHVYVRHATCAAGIHAVSSGLESLQLTSPFFLCRRNIFEEQIIAICL